MQFNETENRRGIFLTNNYPTFRCSQTVGRERDQCPENLKNRQIVRKSKIRSISDNYVAGVEEFWWDCSHYFTSVICQSCSAKVLWFDVADLLNFYNASEIYRRLKEYSVNILKVQSEAIERIVEVEKIKYDKSFDIQQELKKMKFNPDSGNIPCVQPRASSSLSFMSKYVSEMPRLTPPVDPAKIVKPPTALLMGIKNDVIRTKMMHYKKSIFTQSNKRMLKRIKLHMMSSGSSWAFSRRKISSQTKDNIEEGGRRSNLVPPNFMRKSSIRHKGHRNTFSPDLGRGKSMPQMDPHLRVINM